MGLLLVSFTHVLFYYYCPYLEGEAPSWLYVVAGLALFAYQVIFVHRLLYFPTYVFFTHFFWLARRWITWMASKRVARAHPRRLVCSLTTDATH